MPIEFENHGLTGSMDPNGVDGRFPLKHPPVTGPNGEWLILVEPIHGPVQREEVDWGVTGSNYDEITYNLENSSIKKIRQHDISVIGETGIGPVVRVIYEYEE